MTLVPEALRTPTPGADLPADDTAGAWVAFANQQTGQLARANLDKASGWEIIARCEARDAETLKRLTKRPWWARG